LTLTPMMCSKLLRHEENPGRIFLLIERFLTALERGYRVTLGGLLAHRGVVILVMVPVAGSCAFFFANLKSELAPLEDRGVIRVRAIGPEGATLAYTSRYSAEA